MKPLHPSRSPRSSRRSAALAAMLLALSTGAMAQDLMLRIGFDAASQRYQLTHAQEGRFAGQPELPDARDGDLIVLARNAAGQELFRRTLRNPGQHMAEVFDPKTGQIVEARAIQRDGVVELRLPHPAEVATLELQEQRVARGSKSRPGQLEPLSASNALLRLNRQELGELVAQSQAPAAAARGLEATAVPSGSALLWNSGASGQRMDIVLIGDGYTSAQMSKWQADAQKISSGILADPLFAAYKNSFNVRRVDIASPQSGVSEGGVTRQPALGTVIGCYGLARLVCADEAKVLAAMGSVTAADGRDVIIVVANSTTYGGAGGNIGTMTMHPSSIEIALHEIGHTAFKLADEYDYGTCATSSEPSEVNVTRGSSRSTAKWGSLIASSTAVPTQPGSYANGTLGLFLGAKYCTSGVYRPTENSRMRTLGQPWHKVNENRAGAVFASYTGSTPPDTGGAVTVNGSLAAAGASARHPSASPGYVQSVSGGNFTLKLSGPATANFNLSLYKWNGSAWGVVAKSELAGSTESISYAGTAGYYYAQVNAISGSGAYSLSYTFPK